MAAASCKTDQARYSNSGAEHRGQGCEGTVKVKGLPEFASHPMRPPTSLAKHSDGLPRPWNRGFLREPRELEMDTGVPMLVLEIVS